MDSHTFLVHFSFMSHPMGTQPGWGPSVRTQSGSLLGDWVTSGWNPTGIRPEFCVILYNSAFDLHVLLENRDSHTFLILCSY